MTRGWVSTVARHKWMGAIALKALVYVQTMGLVTVSFQIVIEALVVGVLEGSCGFAVMYNNQSSLSTTPQSCEGFCAILNLNCSSYETHHLIFCAHKRKSCIYLKSCCDLHCNVDAKINEKCICPFFDRSYYGGRFWLWYNVTMCINCQSRCCIGISGVPYQ